MGIFAHIVSFFRPTPETPPPPANLYIPAQEDVIEVEELYGPTEDPQSGAPPSLLTNILSNLSSLAAVTTMGLFRLPGGGALNDVYKKFIRDRCNVDIEPIAKDPLALSTFLKRVLASIAGGFLPLVLAVEDPKQYDEETLVDLIIAGLRSMGTPHLAVLFAVIRYFKETLLLDEYTQITKQSPLALGNLFPTPFFRLAIGDDYMIAGKRNADAAAVIKLLIERGDHIMAAVGPLNPARIPSPPPAPLKQKPPVQHPEPPQRNQSLVAVTDSAATLHTSSVDSIIDSSGVGKRRRLRKVRFFRCCCGRAQED